MAKTKTARRAPEAPKSAPIAPAADSTVGDAPADRTIQGPVLSRQNYLLLGAALIVIVIGFVALSRGSITLAPILIVTGYLFLVPMAILRRVRSGE